MKDDTRLNPSKGSRIRRRTKSTTTAEGNLFPIDVARPKKGRPSKSKRQVDDGTRPGGVVNPGTYYDKKRKLFVLKCMLGVFDDQQCPDWALLRLFGGKMIADRRKLGWARISDCKFAVPGAGFSS